MKRVLHWFRRDLRVTDNTALSYACREADEIIPVYLLSTWKRNHRWTGPNRQEFLCGCLESLAKNLEHIGGRLILRSGLPNEQLIKLAQETRAKAIYLNQNYSRYDVEIEHQLRQVANAAGIKIRSFKDTVILAPNEVLNQSDEPFRVFTPYARAWHRHGKPDPLPKVRIMKTPSSIRSESMPTLDHWGLTPEVGILEPGEKAARNRLRNFLKEAIFEYGAQRNRPSLRITSRLSQDLRFGTISPREVYAACQKVALDCTAAERRSVSAFVNELIWREFYFQILWHFPNVLHETFNPQFSTVRWDYDPARLSRWCEGITGFPIVDAGMRELNETGFMHNRARMIVAMFLTKDLHIHWREGENILCESSSMAISRRTTVAGNGAPALVQMQLPISGSRILGHKPKPTIRKANTLSGGSPSSKMSTQYDLLTHLPRSWPLVIRFPWWITPRNAKSRWNAFGVPTLALRLLESILLQHLSRRLGPAGGSKSLFASIWVPSCRDWVIFQSVESPNLRRPPGRPETDRRSRRCRQPCSLLVGY